MAKKRIFISFDYDDKNYRNLLTAWDSHDDFDFEFYDGSLRVAVDSEDAPYIRSVIKPKILASSHFLCIVGENTHKSDWVAWEIEKAVEAKKKLIGVKIEKAFSTPTNLFGVGATWALSFTFASIKAAVDAA